MPKSKAAKDSFRADDRLQWAKSTNVPHASNLIQVIKIIFPQNEGKSWSLIIAAGVAEGRSSFSGEWATRRSDISYSVTRALFHKIGPIYTNYLRSYITTSYMEQGSGNLRSLLQIWQLSCSTLATHLVTLSGVGLWIWRAPGISPGGRSDDEDGNMALTRPPTK